MTLNVFIKSYGCQMNVYDSDRMEDILKGMGYKPTTDLENAHLVILNTCHIREKASEKVYSDLGRLLQIKQERGEGEFLVTVAGCVAQAEGQEILKRAPYVDIIVGPQTYHHLPQLIKEAKSKRPKHFQKGSGLIYTEFPIESKFDFLPEINQPQGVAAFLSVQEGCDKMCTFCVVPYTRGAEYSRPAKDILKEAEKLISLGVREITLLGQNVTAYHGLAHDGVTEWRLSDLIYELAKFSCLDRIRYTTSHPLDMKEDIIEVHAKVDKLMPYLHLPIQSGSDRILKLMNRRYKSSDYRNLINAFRKVRPDIAFATDIIVGFPGETDQDFEDTLKLVEEVQFCGAYSFKYSPRPGTPSANNEDQVPEEIKDERLYRLQKMLNHSQDKFNDSMISKTMPVLFEKPGKYPGQIVGRSPYLQPVHVLGTKELIGTIKDVLVTSREAHSLMGILEAKKG